MSQRRNIPTPEGRKLGAQLARLTEGSIGEMLANGIEVPERCKSCAFREGTFPNGCAETVIDALHCVITGATFHCHIPREGDPDPVCGGWSIAVAEGHKIPVHVQNAIISAGHQIQNARKEPE